MRVRAVRYRPAMPSSVAPSLARALTPQCGCIVAPPAAAGELSVAAMGNGRDALVFVTDASAFASAARSSTFDFVIVDAALPHEDALAAIRAARGLDALAVVLVVATAFDGCVSWLEAGADLVLPHPLRAGDLDVAFDALARRARALLKPLAERIAVPWRLRLADAKLVTPAGVEVSLSPAETLLLEALAQRPGTSLARSELARAAGILEDGKRNVDAAMYRMRKRIEAAAGELAPVRALHGQGYAIAAPLEVVREA